jgi:DNA-binding transcriptional ArsR family regulator
VKDSSLLPLLRSQTQGDLLALLFMNPEEEFTLAEAARKIGVSAPGVHEVTRLKEAGFIEDRREGNHRLIRAATDSLIAKPLTDLLALTYGPLPVLSKLLSKVKGIQQAHIYGSWAARYLGETGPIPKDVDVLVVGTTDLDDLYSVAEEAGKLLHREVNIRRVSPDTWESASGKAKLDQKGSNSFLSSVRSKPMVEISLLNLRYP